jgi:Domain of Unknown Function (DUF928)
MINLSRSSRIKFLSILLAMGGVLSPLVIILAPSHAAPSGPSVSPKPSTTPARSSRRRLVFNMTARRGPVGSRESGGVRGGCTTSANKLTTLVPANNIGDTTLAYPQLFAYVPPTKAKVMELMVKDTTNGAYKELYSTQIPIPATGGIVTIPLSEKGGQPPLEVGKQYHWSLSIVCDADDFSGNPTAEGWIRRVESSPTLTTQLQTVTPDARPALYADAGIWYETIASIVELRKTRPADPTIQQDWEDLLRFAELTKLAQERPVDCCRLQ